MLWKLFVRWDVIAILISIGVVLGFELLGVFTTRYVTITFLLRSYVPRWALAMVWGWLAYHFLFGPQH